jgi:hypothetical protein
MMLLPPTIVSMSIVLLAIVASLSISFGVSVPSTLARFHDSKTVKGHGTATMSPSTKPHGSRPVAVGGMLHHHFTVHIGPVTTAFGSHTYSVLLAVPIKSRRPGLGLHAGFSSMVDLPEEKGTRTIAWIHLETHPGGATPGIQGRSKVDSITPT